MPIIKKQICHTKRKRKEMYKILGVNKTEDGELKYLIKWKTENKNKLIFLDSWIMRTMYPHLLISYYEKIMMWNQ